ncbi:hypothetical protein [Kibdelosporangium aridum]|uniref:hypothetical protein n=1 Tax=Kibdelosporangium aridum TaxID=2030 RepID=UPI000527F225
MRKKTFFGSVALGIAGLVLAAPLANASGTKGSLGFDKNPVKPGDFVGMIGDCNAPGFTTEKVQSPVLEPFEVYLKDDGVGGMTLNGYGEVKKNAKPGTYPVSYQCGTVRVTANLTVIAGDKAPTATEKPKPKPATPKTGTPKPAPVKEAQVEVKPKGAADTGEGGDVVVNAAPDAQESNVGAYALGGAGLLAAGGAGAFFLRRRSRA